MHNVDLPIAQVTVLEDRAFIRREGLVDLPAGSSRWRIQGVSSVLVDKSLALQVDGNSQLVHSRVERLKPQPPPPPPPPPPAESPESLAARKREQRRLAMEISVLDRELVSANSLFNEVLQDISLHASWGTAQEESWPQEIEEIVNWRAQLTEQRWQLQKQLKVAETPPPAPPLAKPAPAVPAVMTTDIVFEIRSQAARQTRVTIDYCVPVACWRPHHRAVWQGDHVTFYAEGCIWQNTGEDWVDVAVVLSTQRISLGTTPPKLVVDQLSARKKATEVVVQEREVQVRELPKARVAPELPGIDDGGSTVNLRSPVRCSIPSHGQAVRVPLFEFESPGLMENVLMAEICSDVVQQTRLTNHSPHALLAGPVDLIREAGWMGRAKIDYVGAGSTFVLGWGAHPSLRCARHTHQAAEEKDDMLGSWMRTHHSTQLTLSNLSGETLTVRVVERVPVSELKQVEIALDPKSTRPAAEADENGFVEWKIDVAPRARFMLSLGYLLRRRKEVATV